MNSTCTVGNDRVLESMSVLSNNNITIPPIINDTNSTSSDKSVKAILNTKYNHHLKKGGKIIDSLPGIIDNFGYYYDGLAYSNSDRVRGKRKSPIQVNQLKSSELKDL